MSVEAAPRLLVLGLGNVLCGDDGLGLAVLEQLRRGFVLPEQVSLVDGGTLGLALLATLEEADQVLVLDAVRTEDPPGTFVRIDGSQVEPALRERLSPHQVGVADLLDALHWRDTFPRRLVVMGLVPERITAGVGLSDAVRRQLPRLLAEARQELARAGCPTRPREGDEAACDSDSGGGTWVARLLGV